MTLLREIQSAATESKVDISTVLRKSGILAARLQNPELEVWVDRELNGYGDGSVLPPYRVVPVEVRGHLRNRSGLHWNPAPIMTASMPERLRAWGEACYLRQPIAEIASLAADARDGSQLQVPWPQELAVRFGAEGYNGFECLGAWQVVSPQALVGVVDTVRNRILDFSLKIEAENPDAGEAPPGTQPVPRTRQVMIFQNTFYAPVGSLAQNSHDFAQL
jgi:hypothetical protein